MENALTVVQDVQEVHSNKTELQILLEGVQPSLTEMGKYREDSVSFTILTNIKNSVELLKQQLSQFVVESEKEKINICKLDKANFDLPHILESIDLEGIEAQVFIETYQQVRRIRRNIKTGIHYQNANQAVIDTLQSVLKNVNIYTDKVDMKLGIRSDIGVEVLSQIKEFNKRSSVVMTYGEEGEVLKYNASNYVLTDVQTKEEKEFEAKKKQQELKVIKQKKKEEKVADKLLDLNLTAMELNLSEEEKNMIKLMRGELADMNAVTKYELLSNVMNNMEKELQKAKEQGQQEEQEEDEVSATTESIADVLENGQDFAEGDSNEDEESEKEKDKNPVYIARRALMQEAKVDKSEFPYQVTKRDGLWAIVNNQNKVIKKTSKLLTLFEQLITIQAPFEIDPRHLSKVTKFQEEYRRRNQAKHTVYIK